MNSTLTSDHKKKLLKLENLVDFLIENKKVDSIELLKAMKEYAEVYEKFRPFQITGNHPYFGTVKRMDGIFYILQCFLNIEPSYTFSKSFPTFEETYNIPRLKKREYEEILWGSLKKDLESISKVISFSSMIYEKEF